jgi:hypothetical protein
MTISAANVPPLDYAPPRRRRRRWVLRGGVAVVLLALAVAAVRWGPTYWAKARLLYWQRRCLTYHAPADLVVYEKNSPDAARLAALGGEYANAAPSGPPGMAPFPPVAAHLPLCWKGFVQRGGAASSSRLRFWTTTNRAVLFLHERISKNGARRLVVVLSDFSTDMRPLFINEYDVVAASLNPARWNTGASEDQWPVKIRVTNGLAPKARLKINAGQPDPADASHFTIRYERDGASGTVDGWLRDQSPPALGGTWVELRDNR